MDDLGHALALGGDEIRMLGGGQPAHIPVMDARWRQRLSEIVANEGELEHMLGNYEPPAGNLSFRAAVAGLFREKFGWQVGVENIGVTMGGQTAFFFLFNALAGRFMPIVRKKSCCLSYLNTSAMPISRSALRSLQVSSQALS